MIEYPKIDTLFERDKETFKVLGKFRRPEFTAVTAWAITEKIDGTNIRIHFDRLPDVNGSPAVGVQIAGRTAKADLPLPLLEALRDVVEEITPEVTKIVDEFGIDSYTLFGEGYGAKIQKGGGNYRPDNGFILFDVLVNDRTWLSVQNVSEAAERLGLDRVPVLGLSTIDDAVKFVANGFNSTIAQTEHAAEGVVAQPIHPLYDARGRRVIWKLKHSDFPA